MLSLQAHSHEQKTRVCWCLIDNILKQQPRTTPTAPPAESKVRGSKRKGWQEKAHDSVQSVSAVRGVITQQGGGKAGQGGPFLAHELYGPKKSPALVQAKSESAASFLSEGAPRGLPAGFGPCAAIFLATSVKASSPELPRRLLGKFQRLP